MLSLELSKDLSKSSKAENKCVKEKETPKDWAAKCQGYALSLRFNRGQSKADKGGR